MRIGNYVIENDPLNWVLKKELVTSKGKNKGKVRYEVLGYYSDLGALVRNITDDRIKEEWGNHFTMKEAVEAGLLSLLKEELNNE